MVTTFLSISTRREPEASSVTHRPTWRNDSRGFVVPDASMPGPVGRSYIVELDEESGSEDTSDGDSQNQDRI